MCRIMIVQWIRGVKGAPNTMLSKIKRIMKCTFGKIAWKFSNLDPDKVPIASV